MLCWPLLLLALAAASPLEEVERTPVTIRVATYNVWGLPWPLAPDRRRRLGRVGRWAEARHVDVLALQEVWGGSGRHVARGLPDGFRLHRPVAAGDSGLALATAEKVEPSGIRVFSARRGPDALKRKGVWWVQVDVADASFTLATLHLQAGRSDRNAQVRRTQLETVLAELPEGPVILVGDFNLHDGEVDDATHAMLEAAGLAEVHTVSDGPTSRYGRDRLDRVYVRDVDDIGLLPRVARVGRPSALSDHHPVWVDLQVVP